MNKFIIKATDHDIGVMLCEWWPDEKKALLESRFLQCLSLERWVETNPDSFVVEKWEGENRWKFSDTEPPPGWRKAEEITYLGVEWMGEVKHSCGEEMSACHGSVYFTYKEKRTG